MFDFAAEDLTPDGLASIIADITQRQNLSPTGEYSLRKYPLAEFELSDFIELHACLGLALYLGTHKNKPDAKAIKRYRNLRQTIETHICNQRFPSIRDTDYSEFSFWSLPKIYDRFVQLDEEVKSLMGHKYDMGMLFRQRQVLLLELRQHSDLSVLGYIRSQITLNHAGEEAANYRENSIGFCREEILKTGRSIRNMYASTRSIVSVFARNRLSYYICRSN